MSRRAAAKSGDNPYFGHFFRVNFDGSGFQTADARDGESQRHVFAGRQVFRRQLFDARHAARCRSSRHDRQTDRRSREGRCLASQGHGMAAAGAIHRKARDGVTDLYGLMYLPTNLDTNKKYPIIDYIYPGPQGGGSRRPRSQFLGVARRQSGAGRARLCRCAARRNV